MIIKLKRDCGKMETEKMETFNAVEIKAKAENIKPVFHRCSGKKLQKRDETKTVKNVHMLINNP